MAWISARDDRRWKSASTASFPVTAISCAGVCRMRSSASWDGWLQECLAASRAALGERWLDIYLTSPAWRFACAAGACGPAPVVGVMVPSVDRVGRYFPLTSSPSCPTSADRRPRPATPRRSSTPPSAWSIETLAADHVDFERFDSAVDAAGRTARVGCAVPPDVVLESAAAPRRWTTRPPAGRCRLRRRLQLAVRVRCSCCRERLSALYEPLVLWWTDGSATSSRAV